MEFPILTVIALLCQNQNFNVQRDCQKKLIECIAPYHITTNSKAIEYELSMCIAVKRRNMFQWTK